jgi:hypothetical protein
MYKCQIGGEIVVPHCPPYKLVAEKLRPSRDALLRSLRGSNPVSIEEVVDMYRARKRKIYSDAAEQFYAHGCTRQHSISRSFVKCEKTNTSKAPRNIQPRHPVYNLEIACYLKPIEKRVQKIFKRLFGQPTILKGYDANTLGGIMESKWSSFRSPVAIGLDAVKFDMHFSPAVLQWEHDIYNEAFRCPRLKQLLLWQMHNIGTGHCYDGSLKYRVKGKRFSGDINTSLGNCLVMCSMLHSFFKSHGIQGQLANNGDDCVVFLEEEDVDVFTKSIEQWFGTLGFRITLEKPVYALEEIEFCQCHPLPVNGRYRMVRNIPTALSKDACSIYDFQNEVAWRRWLYQVGECGLALCSGVPIMEEYYSAFMRNGIPSERNEHYFANSGMVFMADGLVAHRLPITSDARWAVYAAWQYTPDEQVALEERYRQLVLNWGDGPGDESAFIQHW